jgi:hypothetical protein
MKKSLFAVAALTVAVASSAGAQTTCPGGVPTLATAPENAKQQAADLFQYVAPQLAQAVAGGSATLGQNSTLGGLGHFSLGVHGTAVGGSVPDVTKFPTCYTGKYSAVLPTSTALIPMAGADAAIGIFGGLPLALTNVGGIDLLVSAQYVPEKTFSGVRVTTPDGSLQLGYGARIGLLSESLIVPGVSLSYIKRDLPRVSVAANNGSDSLLVNGLKVKSSSWRLTASKSLIFFGLGAGVGQDKFDSRVDTVRASVGAPTLARTSGNLLDQAQNLTRTNYFVNATFSLLVAKITAEVGQSTGGTVTTFNTFQGSQADGTRTYGSVGVRFGL